jgi:DNA excision repair protein ERCC-1
MSDDPRRGFGFASGSGGGGGGGAPGGGGGAPSQNRISSQTNANTQVQNNHNQSASQSNALQGNTVFVSRTQNGNPLLRHIRNVRWVFADVVPDFVLNENACVVFISLRYHLLHPTYLPTKIAALQKAFRLRVVLCQVDTEDVIKPLGEVNKIAAMGGCSLLCAWSPEEAGRYVETLKAFEKKAPDIIKERVETDYLGRLQAALTSVRGVNKTDATSLGANFGSFAGVLRASEVQLAATPGLGPTKVKRLREAANAPFRRRGGGTSGTTNGTTNGTQPATEVLPPPE